MVMIASILDPASPPVYLRSKLVDGRCEIQSPVALVDVAVQSFPWFSLKLS